MTSNRQQLIGLLEQNAIDESKINDALIISKVQPSKHHWVHFFNQLLAWLGGLAITFSVLFFIAFNWHEMGKFAKFALVEILIVFAIVAYYQLNKLAQKTSKSLDDSNPPPLKSIIPTVSESVVKVPLFMAAVFFGVLLALFGQTYQTGADPWQLFFNWALLILPWVVIGRLGALWMLWVVLINVSILLYYLNFGGRLGWFINQELNALWVILLFNIVALACWEGFSRHYHWLKARWAPRLLAVVSGACITWLMVGSIWSFTHDSYLHSAFKELGFLPITIWPLWLLAMYVCYRHYQKDLFMLAGTLLSANIVIINYVSAYWLETLEEIGLLLISNMMIAMAAGSAIGLRKINKEWQS
ncbi:DUF2157 domain-containing protein [Shewanella electrodiphila]|uniref:DUF2157 domain-containing protein n=1 Tax=Shewanella electrodiphila TaxID=934143 RepID=A0ABT0KRS9_9GAMM|nr:DUF2157 domain-containing protein [Shewanella electrodiphila]MCL1046463.1 DUF2157 domain-containing protein [Shewanella electrodiphila]